MSDALKWCREIEREPITDEVTLGLVRIVRAAVSAVAQFNPDDLRRYPSDYKQEVALRDALDDFGETYRNELESTDAEVK